MKDDLATRGFEILKWRFFVGSHGLLVNMASVFALFAFVFASRSTHALRFQHEAGACLQVAEQTLGKVIDVASGCCLACRI